MHKTYEHFDSIMRTARSEYAGKPLQNNTRLFRRDDLLAVRLHSTDVVTIWPDGKFALNSGGWQTVTTKDRINSYAPVRIASVKGTWYVSHDKTRKDAEAQTRREFGLPIIGNLHDAVPDGYNFRAFYRRIEELCLIPYFDGIMFDADGNCLNGIDPETWQAYCAMRDDRERMIQRYCTGFFQALKKGMPVPSGGDCWHCAMRTDKGLSLGDVTESVDHLLAHIEERYYVPSLVWNAMKEAGYQDVGVAIHLGYDREAGTIGGPAWREAQSGMDGGMVRRDLRNFLRARLIPEPPSERNGFRFDGDTLPLIAQHRAQRTASQ